MALTEAQEKWAVALESGDYQQTDGLLRKGDGYCCLGVGCDLSALGEWNIDNYGDLTVTSFCVRTPVCRQSCLPGYRDG